MATGITPNGTPWTTYTTVIDDETVRWGVANSHLNDLNLPVVHYAHGSGGGNNQFETLSAWKGLRDWLLDNGWAWIEGTGGSSQSWGGPLARVGYEKQFAHVDTILDIGSVVVLGRSMGGFIAYWLATQSTYADRVSGVMINSGTTDLAFRYANSVPTAKGWMKDAYGATSDADFTAKSVGYDPMLFPIELWDGKNILELYGTADTTVEPEPHAIAWAKKYATSLDHLNWFGFDVREGGDHSAPNGSYLQVAAMTQFLNRAISNVWPEWVPLDPPNPNPEPEPGTYKKVLFGYRMINGRRHKVRFRNT